MPGTPNLPIPFTIARVRVLTGHTGPDTAYLVGNHHDGDAPRAEVRFWIHTASHRPFAGKQRFAYQTRQPRRPDVEWNQPHFGAYFEIAALYLDDQGAVQWWGTGGYVHPAADARMRLMGIYDQLPDADRDHYDQLVIVAQRPGASALAWQTWDQTVTALADHIRRTGTDPDVVHGTWRGPTRSYYLTTDPAPYIVTARHRATGHATPPGT